MNRSKNIQIKVGIILICLVLAGTLFQPASSRGAGQSNPEGMGNSLVYLPVLRRPFLFTMSRVSVASDGTEGNNQSWDPSISADGRYVTFISAANNLVNGDNNGMGDAFVHDRHTGQTTLVSVASNGIQANSGIGWPSISADGRYVAFSSYAFNLVPGDSNGDQDIFVHDRQTGETRRISIATNGTQSNANSWGPSLSADGRYVTFVSYANNLVSGDTNDDYDIFVHDQQTGQTTRVSVASDGTQGNGNSGLSSISADGRYVVFLSSADNLVSGDTNLYDDIFVHDRQTGQTTLVSVASNGTQSNNHSTYFAISGNGRYVAFQSYADNLVSGDTNFYEDIFVHDRQTGQTRRVSVATDSTQANRSSSRPSISADGRYVAFGSSADNLVSGDTNNSADVFVYDQQTGQTTIISLTSNGLQSNGHSEKPSVSGDGRYISFRSDADNLVSGDNNGEDDIFVYDRGH